MIREALQKVTAGESLGSDEATGVLREILAGEASAAQVGALLTALRVKGETPAEIAGFARAMRDAAIRVHPRRSPLVDTCGTGGGSVPTFNISTAAAFVAAGAGVAVAKHGNRGMTSACGSADVLEALGVRIDCAPPAVIACVDDCGIGFLFAQAHHPAMRHVAPVRRELPYRTIFNLLGPLTNPAGAAAQVIGVYDPALLDPLAEALRALGCSRALVVHGVDGLDELSTLGATGVTELRDGDLRSYMVQPEELGLPRAAAEQVAPAGTVAENAALLAGVLEGERGPRRDIVLLNAAAALLVAGAAPDLKDGLALAAESIDRGQAARVLDALRERSQRAA
jgi:anthranilate phosphoribosyltransferase